MLVIRGYKYRLYPTDEQKQWLEQNFGCCRYVFNHMLDRQMKIYSRRGEHMLYNEMQNLLPKMKEYLPWLRNADSQALKYACRQVDAAYQGFFRRVKQGKKPGFPKFKSRKNPCRSYTSTNGASMHISDGKVKLPVIGWVEAVTTRFPSGEWHCHVRRMTGNRTTERRKTYREQQF